jgi:hypothetical protein
VRTGDNRVLPSAPRALEIALEAHHPVPPQVAGHDQPSLPPQGDRLPAGRRRRVVDRRARGQVGIPDEECLRRILNQERAFSEAGKLLRAPPIGHQPGAICRRLDRDAGRSPALLQVGGALPRRLKDETRPSIIPFQKTPSLLGAVAPEPALHQPDRVGMTLGESHRIGQIGVRLRHRRQRLGLGAEAPEHRVHEPAGTRPAFLSRERHTGIHRRVRRDPVENHQLVRAETEQVLQPRRHPRPVSGDQRRKAGIEGLLASQHARRHLVREPAVVVVQLPERAIEGRVERATGAHLGEDVERCSSRGQASDCRHRGWAIGYRLSADCLIADS